MYVAHIYIHRKFIFLFVCSGIDITDNIFFSGINNNSDDDIDIARRGIIGQYNIIKDMQQCFTNVEECPIPVISIIHGICYGAGIDLVCCTDIRYCTNDVKFSIKEVQIGLAADIGTLQRLPKITGNSSLIKEYCYTGQIFNKTIAERMGLISSSNNISGSTTKEQLINIILNTTCKQIISNSPMAIIGTKKSLLYSRDHTVLEGLDHIATYNSLALMTDDIPIAIEAAVTKSKNKKKNKDNNNTIPSFQDIPKYSRL